MITDVSGYRWRKFSNSHSPSYCGIFMSLMTSGVSSAAARSSAICAPDAQTQL